ncbi:MAG TPA: hypothetical protein VJK02_02930 [Anaerolineales bacterium]|nr:hypothetical protein [Anaerolineales bacterium]
MKTHQRDLRRRGVAGTYSVVAAINYFDGELFDWAAYLGEGNSEHIAAHGEKCDHDVAHALFPDLPEASYRL